MALPDGRPGERLTVADDGVGIPDGGRRSGLENLRRRAECLGGDRRHGPDARRRPQARAGRWGTTVAWEAPY